MRTPSPTERARAPRSVPLRQGVSQWLKSIRVSWFAVLMIMVIVMFVVIIAPGFRVFVEQRQQIADLEAQARQAQTQNAALEAQVARWSDPAYVRAQARDRLYYVMPGETSLLVINDVPPADPATDVVGNPTPAPAHTDWLSSLFVSSFTAGLATSTPTELEEQGTIEPAGEPEQGSAPAEGTEVPAQ